MSRKENKFPVKVIVSMKQDMEFPFDWTKNEAHKDVAVVSGFTAMFTAYNESELGELYRELKGFDYATDSPNSTLLFTTGRTLEKFFRFIPYPKSQCRVLTIKDKETYGI